MLNLSGLKAPCLHTSPGRAAWCLVMIRLSVHISVLAMSLDQEPTISVGHRLLGERCFVSEFWLSSAPEKKVAIGSVPG